MFYELIERSSPELRNILLHAYSERDRLLVETCGFDLWMYDCASNQFHVTYCTPDGQIHTLSKEVTLGLANVVSLLAPEDEELFFNTLHELAKDPTLPEEGNMRFRYFDLSKTIDSHYRCIKNDQGKPEAVIGFSQDSRESDSKIRHLLNQRKSQMHGQPISQVHIEEGTDSLRVILVDLRDYSFRLLQGTPQMRQAASMPTDAVSYFQAITQEVITSEQERERLAAFFDLETLADRLSQERVIAINYHVDTYGEVCLRVSPARVEQDGTVSQIIVSIQVC